MNHIDMRRVAEFARANDVHVELIPIGFRIISRDTRGLLEAEHVLAYEQLWQAIDPVGIFEYEIRRVRGLVAGRKPAQGRAEDQFSQTGIAMTYDFSKPETQALYESEVRKRVGLFGMTRQQAEMLVAVLMAPPLKPETDAGEKKR